MVNETHRLPFHYYLYPRRKQYRRLIIKIGHRSKHTKRQSDKRGLSTSEVDSERIRPPCDERGEIREKFNEADMLEIKETIKNNKYPVKLRKYEVIKSELCKQNNG